MGAGVAWASMVFVQRRGGAEQQRFFCGETQFGAGCCQRCGEHRTRASFVTIMKMTSKKLTVGSGGLNARWIQSFCTASIRLAAATTADCCTTRVAPNNPLGRTNECECRQTADNERTLEMDSIGPLVYPERCTARMVCGPDGNGCALEERAQQTTCTQQQRQHGRFD